MLKIRNALCCYAVLLVQKETRKTAELASTDTLGLSEKFEQALRELVAATAPKSCRNSIARP